jgi:subtilase family serine protease
VSLTKQAGGKRLRSRTSIFGIVASIALLASVVPALAAPAPRATLVGNVPPWAKSANFKAAANTTDSIGFRVYLGWTDPAAVEALAKAVSDPQSASYGQYLTPQQFRQRFAPSQTQVNAVQGWLRSQGFSVVYTPQNNHYVSAEGTVAQAAAAFGTSFGMYSVDGLTLRSPSSDISVPASIAGSVSGVIGLDDVAQTVHTNHIAADPNATPSPAFVNAPPLADYWGQLTASYPNPYGEDALPYAVRGYTPQQVKDAYGLGNTTFDGSGVTVAIIDAYASPTIQSDLNMWSVNRGMSSTTITQVVAPGTYNHPESGLRQDPQGWYGEETLDVEAVHGMAPGAHIVYVGSPNNFQDLDAALNHVVDRHLASIVTNSYGFNTELLPPGFVKPYEDTIMQGATEGITINFSSGDSSDESHTFGGFRTVDWPASSPFVTAVGGTSLAVGADNNYLFETGWGTTNRTWTGTTWGSSGWLYGSGGGVSRIFAEPAYQQGVVQDSVFAAQGHGTGRALPDVSALGDPQTGYLVGQTQTFFATSATAGGARYSEYRIGGTSLSSPIMAGIFALANQARNSKGKGDLGFANPLLYSLNGTSAVTDIVDPQSTVAIVRVNYKNGEDATNGTSVRLRTMNQTLSLQTTPGWDDVTGIGTPTGSFVGALTLSK